MVPAVGETVCLARRKWPDSPHYEVTGRVLGRDEHGTWVGTHPGSTVRMPDGTQRRGERRVVWCVPADAWFLVHFLEDHHDLDVYVDICTPFRWGEGGRGTTVDLDFDVVVWNADKGGHVELVDEDEFEDHRVAYGYPDDLQAAARRAAADVLALVQAGTAPFTTAAAAPWFEVLGP